MPTDETTTTATTTEESMSEEMETIDEKIEDQSELDEKAQALKRKKCNINPSQPREKWKGLLKKLSKKLKIIFKMFKF